MANLLEEASILLTPTAYNDGKMLSVKPTNGDGDFIFTRNSAATRVNAQGLVDSVSENLPRINYEGGCGSWLLEPQSTNLYLNSETLFTQNNTTLASTYTVSFYGTGTITFSGTYNGTLIGTGLNNRVSLTFTTASGTLISTVSGTCTKGQLENLTYPTSYIPTSGAISTRLRDLSGNSGNTVLINSTEGVLYVDFAAYSTQNTREITLSDGTSSNRIIISYNSNNRLDVNLYTSGGYQAIFNYTGISDSTAFNKIAFKYKENDCSLWVNGVEVGVDTNAPIMPIGLDILNLASSNGATNIMYGKVNAVAVFKTALTDEQLTALTTI